MSGIHTGACALYALAKADFLERVRRYSFLVTLAFAVFVGQAAARGQISLRLGEFVGSPNSAWVGALMALTTTVFLSLAGFYIVSNSIDRDQVTRVGSILAATPMSRFSYMLAKAASNFAVLSAMVAILAVAGVLTVIFSGFARLELWPLLSPFLFIALPGMALVAAVAVFFEATPVLRRVSAFVYIFVWVSALANFTHGAFDPIGIQLISTQMATAIRAIDPGYKNAISFGFMVGDSGRPAIPQVFVWHGVAWTWTIIWQHLLLFPLAAGIALLPGLWFHRFDPSRQWLKRRRNKSTPQVEEQDRAAQAIPRATQALRASQLTLALPQRASFVSYLSLIACELRLLAARRKWWIYVFAAAFIVASFTVPLEGGRHFLVAAVWIVPMLYWSRLGSREDLFATRAMVMSAPHASLRPVIASWIAGSLLPLLLASGILFRLVIAREFLPSAGLVVGAFFAVALALAIGNLSRTPKTFEALYVVWWYFGPWQAVRGMDFVGVDPGNAMPAVYAGIAVALILVAWGTRELRLARA
jgi:hypothetical protein